MLQVTPTDLALIVISALAVVFFVRLRRAQRQLAHLAEANTFRGNLIANQDEQIVGLLEKIEAMDAERVEPRGAA